MKLTAKQEQAIRDWSDTDIFEICYDGGARSGKTWMACYAIIQRAGQYRNSRHLISRLRANHLEISVWRQTLLPMLAKIMPRGGYKVEKVYRTVRLDNGSEIIGLALEDVERIEKIMGTEFSTIFINEAREISYGTYQTLKTRCTQTAGKLSNKIIIDCNPANQYHWIHKYFIQKTDPEMGTALKNTEIITRRGPWLPEENPNLGKRGLEMIRSLTGAQYQRLALGQWVSTEGLVYPEFQDAIVPARKIPESWPVTCAVDFGYTNPFAFVWFAADHSNETYYLFDEYYQKQKTISDHCKFLKSYRSSWRENLRADWIVADHDAGDRAIMHREFAITDAADKDIQTGIQTVRDLLTAKKGWKLRIFETCTNTISELSDYRWPEKKHGDMRDEKPEKSNDHICDCIRYWAKKIGRPAVVRSFGKARTRN